MSKFVFKKSQRIFIPVEQCETPKQAVVVTRKEFGWREHEYGLQCVSDSVFDKDGCLVIEHWAIPESKLVAAQPTAAPSDLKSPVRKRR